MKEYYFAEHLLLRAPARDWRQYFDGEQQHLDDPCLQSAIYLASPRFFDCLKQNDFKFERLSDREKLTVRKYINRSCFRPIPFGLFAGVSLIKWGAEFNLELPEIEPSHVRLFPDQGWVASVSEELIQQHTEILSRYETNPTLYKLVDEYRFIRTEVAGDGITRHFLLQSTDYSAVLQELARFCRIARAAPVVIIKICDLSGCSVDQALDYFSFLRSEHFLVEKYRATIAGPEHTESLLDLIQSASPKMPGVRALQRSLDRLKSVPAIDLLYFQDMNAKLQGHLPDLNQASEPNHLYVILNRPALNGSLPLRLQHQIRDAIFALDCLGGEVTNPAMDQFVRSFQKDFEGQTLDLLYALDPEVGIGYFTEQQPPNPILETLQFAGPEDKDNHFSWTATHRLVLEKWHTQCLKPGSVIVLEEEELKSLRGTRERDNRLGLSVLFRISNDELYLESAGGVNAPALLGRFTIADDKIAAAARAMASELERANPDIIFAELLQLSGTHTDNINRRESIWSYEIPISAASTLPSEKQIALDDLRLKVDKGTVMLYSEKHRKIVVPRLTSAYNHTLDQLPLFRFLVDMAFQYGQNAFGLDLPQLFPGLTYYPRVSYKNTILHLATWILSESQIETISGQDSQPGDDHLKTMLEALGLPRVYSLSEGDQQLIFHRDNPYDRRFFVDCLRRKKEVVVKEFLLEGNSNSKASFVQQFNAFLLPTQPLSLNLPEVINQPQQTETRRLMPGSEWLYLKIYTSRNSSSKLLLRILPLLRRRYGGRRIQRWFFVRYEDHAPHIRLRIEMNAEDISLILIAFKNALANRVSEHVIREYQIDVYNRELERYHAGGISLTEDFFWASSELVVRWLKVNPNLAVDELVLRSTWDMLAVFMSDKVKRLSFVEKTYGHFWAEFGDKRLKIELDQKFRELSPVIHRVASDNDFYRESGLFLPGRNFIRALKTLEAAVLADEAKRDEFIQSIIHMHLNRLFVADARKQELVVYYLLFKFLASSIARELRNT